MAEEKSSWQLVLSPAGGPGSIAVDAAAYFEFSLWLSDRLEELVGDWAHFATPAARTPPASLR